LLFVAVAATPVFSQHAAPNLTERAWKILDDAAVSPSLEKRTHAISALGLISRNAHSEELAVKALADDKPDVRTAAANALGEMSASKAIPALKKTVTDSDPGVVLAAAHSLLLLKDKEAYQIYYAVLTGQRKSGRGLLADQRKMLGDPKKMAALGFETGIGFVPFGGMGLTAYRTLTKDDASPVRAAAAKILSADPDPKSGEAWVTAASDKSWIVRAAALDAIGRRGDRSLAARIEPQLSDERDIVQDIAAAAIIRLRQPAPAKRAPITK
jgi:HEAT repeat protein